MGVVIYGSRSYGRVDAHGGEYAQTQFFHIDFVPLIPRSSFWVTDEVDGERRGFPIKLHLRSVVATYLRVWGAVAAVVAFVALPGLGGALLAGGLAALSAWSWSWRSLRGTQARLRSDFNAVAFGARCEPERLTDDVRQRIHAGLQTQWNANNAGRSPDDVARFGTSDVREAVLAYGLLRMAAADRGRAGAEERAAADRLIDGVHEPLPAGVGPYRASAPDGAVAPMADVVSRLAEAAIAPPRAAVRRKPRWRDKPGVQLAGLALLSVFAVSTASVAWLSIAPPVPVTGRTLDGLHVETGRDVVIDVDDIVDPDLRYTGRDRAHKRLLFGQIGKRLLPIVVASDDAAPGRHVVGRLRLSVGAERSQPWLRAVQANPAVDAATYDYFLDLTARNDARVSIAIGLGVCVGTIVLWVLWVRARLRRRRAA